MKVEKLAPIVEIVGVVAIVVSLAFLTIQTRQNTQALTSTAIQASLDAELGLIYQLSEAAAILNRTRTAEREQELFEESPGDVTRIRFLAMALFRIKQHQWMQFHAGLFDDLTWETYESSMCQLFRNYTIRSAWSAEADNLNPDFVIYMNNWLDSNLDPRGNCF